MDFDYGKSSQCWIQCLVIDQINITESDSNQGTLLTTNSINKNVNGFSLKYKGIF